MRLNVIVAAAVLMAIAVTPAHSQKLENTDRIHKSIQLETFGEIILEETVSDQVETTQLLLQKPGGMREVIDSFEGLVPADLVKYDLDTDGRAEIMALLKHTDGIDVIPYVYSPQNNFKRLFPSPDQENNPLICREIFVSTYKELPALCARHIVSYHDFGPPDLYQLEFYRLQQDTFSLVHKGFTDGDHYNILMNRGAYAMHDGQYLEALDFYTQAISSSTGEISTKALIEATFNLAEARKFTKDFKGALDLYQKIVVEFSQNSSTDAAQQEIELISANINNPEPLSFYIDVSSNINCDRWETALELLQNHPIANASGSLQDRFLFIKAEVLTALNRVEEAIKVYRNIKEQFPESPIIENVDAILEDMEEKPEETDGL
ncbi:MAG: hypothetical protein EOM80_03185 [Erysipelotrichia bacterium]|nr:tetratricopeptide repeat protein [Candidatus Riflebacteria bacterium]NCB37750.1 hypothetical protein [Erysipelotrichia bacterium]